MWAHSVIHGDSLATMELCPELSEVMDTAISTLKYLGLLEELCMESGSLYWILLFIVLVVCQEEKWFCLKLVKRDIAFRTRKSRTC
jgi:hypothetical protein